jgi:hypothetical protein
LEKCDSSKETGMLVEASSTDSERTAEYHRI